MKNIRTFAALLLVLAIAGSDSLNAQEEEPLTHALYGSAGMGTNMVYMGSSISGEKPYYYGSLTYGFKEKLYASVSTFHLAAFDQFTAFNTFALNYSRTVNSWFDFSAGVSRYQVNNELTDTLFSSFFYGDLALGFDWKILYTTISTGGVFAESSGLYLQMKNSRYFQTPQFFKGKAYFSFNPYFNMLFGTLTETTTSTGTTVGVTQPFSPKKTSGRGSAGSTTTTREFFSLMEIDLGMPVAFNMGRVTIEADPGFIIPLYSDTDPLNPKGFSFLLSCYVKIL
jgi:hypothetical protein